MVSESLLSSAQSLAKLFALDGELQSIHPYGDGHINDTFRVITSAPDGEHRYILQRISPSAFHEPVKVMQNIVGVTAFLKASIAARGGDPLRETLTLVPLKNGDYYHIDEQGGCWRTYLFIRDTHSHSAAQSEAVFRASGQAFGAFQLALSDYPAHTLHETIPDFHNTPARYAQLKSAIKAASGERLQEAAADIAFAREREHFTHMLTDQLSDGTLALRVTHNDTKLNNVLMDAKTGEALCVIDLDTVMPGLCAYDFGDAMRFGANKADESESDLSKVGLSLPMFEAYADGYLEKAAHILTDAELESLPIGARLITLECGMRFLADYLNGDIYFHIAYPTHNLVRARNQFALVADMEKYGQEMRSIVLRTAKKYI